MAVIFLYAHDAGINPQQLQKLRRSGYIPVGVRYLSDVKVVEAPDQPSFNLILTAACRAVMRSTDFDRRYFGEEVAKAILALDKEPQE